MTGARNAQRGEVRMHPEACAGLDHPGVTHNPQTDQTWCLCGEKTYEGNQHTHAACCGGPLIEYLNAEERAEGAAVRQEITA